MRYSIRHTLSGLMPPYTPTGTLFSCCLKLEIKTNAKQPLTSDHKPVMKWFMRKVTGHKLVGCPATVGFVGMSGAISRGKDPSQRPPRAFLKIQQDSPSKLIAHQKNNFSHLHHREGKLKNLNRIKDGGRCLVAPHTHTHTHTIIPKIDLISTG